MSKKSKIKKINQKDYKIVWDSDKKSCSLNHSNGIKCKIGAGMSDSVSVYDLDGRILVLSVNYPAQYACIELFSGKELDELIFADKKDISKIFGQNLSGHSPEDVANRLVKELE